MHLEQLPAYAPKLNPDEGMWNYLKGVELANVCCSGLTTLGLALRGAKDRLRHTGRLPGLAIHASSSNMRGTMILTNKRS